MILLIPLILIVVLILGIVFIPVYLKVNTDLNQYEVIQSPMLRIAFYPGQQPAMTMRVFGFRVNTATKDEVTDPRAVNDKKKWTIKRSPSAWLYLLLGIYHSFRLKRFVCTIDLDDVVTNAKLVPVVLLLNRGVVSLSTNCRNRNFLCLNIQVKVYKLLWITFRFYTKE